MNPNLLPKALLAIILMISAELRSQYNPTIQSGRPGQSIVVNTVGKGILQFQQGLSYDKTENPNEDNVMSWPGEGVFEHTSFDNVIRYGLLENFEVNAEVNYVWAYDKYYNGLNDGKYEYSDYLDMVDLGVRYHILDQNGIVPSMALQARLGMGQYTNEGDFEMKNVKITGAFGWQLSPRQSFTINVIPVIDIAGYQNSTVGYTLAYGFSITDRFGFFIENYGGVLLGRLTSNESYRYTTYFDGGFSILLSDDVQLDVLGGYGFNTVSVVSNEISYFISTGVSWRINTTK